MKAKKEEARRSGTTTGRPRATGPNGTRRPRPGRPERPDRPGRRGPTPGGGKEEGGRRRSCFGSGRRSSGTTGPRRRKGKKEGTRPSAWLTGAAPAGSGPATPASKVRQVDNLRFVIADAPTVCTSYM